LDEITNRIYEVDSSLTIRPTGFWRRYINITIKILDSIHLVSFI
jgi:hypothetical protein